MEQLFLLTQWVRICENVWKISWKNGIPTYFPMKTKQFCGKNSKPFPMNAAVWGTFLEFRERHGVFSPNLSFQKVREKFRIPKVLLRFFQSFS